jgi:type II secretory pathway pseudopilin PulG
MPGEAHKRSDHRPDEQRKDARRDHELNEGEPSTTFRAGESGAGFTLIELVVATGVFALLIGTVAGVFVSLTRHQRSGLAQTTILGDAETFLELLEREVRTGYGNTFTVPTIDSFQFKNQDQEQITYCLGNLDLGCTAGSTQIIRIGPTGTERLTSPAVDVRLLEYTAVLATRNDNGTADDLTDDFLGGFTPESDLQNLQGRVTVRIRACPRGVTNDAQCIFVQTTLTSRQYGPL